MAKLSHLVFPAELLTLLSNVVLIKSPQGLDMVIIDSDTSWIVGLFSFTFQQQNETDSDKLRC